MNPNHEPLARDAQLDALFSDAPESAGVAAVYAADAGFSAGVFEKIADLRDFRMKRARSRIRLMVLGCGVLVAVLLPFAVEPVRMGLRLLQGM